MSNRLSARASEERFGRSAWIWIVGAVALCLAGAAWSFKTDPPVFLLAQNSAQWISLDAPWELSAKPPEPAVAFFRKRFAFHPSSLAPGAIGSPVAAREDALPFRAASDGGRNFASVATLPAGETGGGKFSLNYRAMGGAGVYLDGNLVGQEGGGPHSWKTLRSLPLPRNIRPADHEIIFVIRSRSAPAMLLAYSKALDIRTGEDWDASPDGKSWSPARPADKFRPAELSERFPGAERAFVSLLPFYWTVFTAVFLFSLNLNRLISIPWIEARFDRRLDARQARNALWIAWGILALNNFWKIPLNVGFDASGHLDYIAHMARRWRPPFADEGWVMFEPPLYYFICALGWKLISPFAAVETTVRLIRLFSAACGALHVEICRRMMRRLFPNERGPQILAIVFAGTLPMNLYLSQSLGNEALAGCLSAAAVCKTWAVIASGKAEDRDACSLGILLGLALLAKATSFLLVPPIILFLFFRLPRARLPGRKMWSVNPGRAIALMLLTAFLSSGWYYLRNWVHFGKPFVGGWDAVRGILWRQEPGYRTPSQLFSFGRCLIAPVYSGLSGFWDSIYSSFWLDGFLSSMVRFESRPPWNYRWMIAGAWLGLLPTAAMLFGARRFLSESNALVKSALGFSCLCIAIYFSAMLFLFARLPIYTGAKAAYTIGLTPCYALLFAAGLDSLIRGRFSKAAVHAAFACCAVSFFTAYFVF